MNFMFSWQEQYLTSERSERVRYCCCHSNIKFISSRHRVISSIYIYFFFLGGGAATPLPPPPRPARTPLCVNCEANLLYVESDFATTGKSFTVFFARWPVKLDRWVKISVRWGISVIRPLSCICPLRRNLRSYSPSLIYSDFSLLLSSFHNKKNRLIAA